jgi:hypothetical protein
MVPQAESEPNNVLATADSLTVRASVQSGPVAAVAASLASAYDVDVFVADLPAAPATRHYTVELVAHRLSPASGLLPTLEHVVSSESSSEGRVAQSAERCGQPATVDPCLSFTVPPAEGTTRLHLRVKARRNSSGRYTLVLRRI